jgi:hypothetical protein
MSGPYVPTLAGKSSLLDESRLLLEAYAQSGDAQVACKTLIDGALPQRSRQTRATIVTILRARFLRWNPPAWVLSDLVMFAQAASPDIFCLALLLHIARQDVLLYDFVQQVVVSRWYANTPKMMRSDVQVFLDEAQGEHPEVTSWSYSTREKLARNALTVLRDCKLLKGEVKKQIVLPVVPEVVVQHLIRLLRAEGIADEQIAQHPDWRLWLWDEIRAQKALDRYTVQEETR